MIWKLCHRLFGWDYVLVHFDMGMYVRRVKTMPNGERYINIYGVELEKYKKRHWEYLTK